MEEDFLDAHMRHWTDAELLYKSQRWANADHLYGFSAECGLKSLIETLRDAPLPKKERRHIMEAKNESAWQIASDVFETYNGGALGAKFSLQSVNPFTDWEAGQRYANQNHFNQAHVDAHRLGAEQVRALVKLMQRETGCDDHF